MYLTDKDLINILVRCRKNLTSKDGRKGIIFIKENVTDPTDFTGYFDRQDNSLIRCPEYFEIIFKTAGLQVLKKGFQVEWTEECYPLCMWVLTPI